MSESKNDKFMGTYFDRDAVVKVSRWGEILSWVVVGVYAVDLIVALGVFVLQFIRGFWGPMGFSEC